VHNMPHSKKTKEILSLQKLKYNPGAFQKGNKAAFKENSLTKNPKYFSQWRSKNKEKLAGRKKPENCEICDFKGIIVFDHCHQTGKFRGWICSQCNTALGMVEDNCEILMKMIKYINNNR
jgi:hypothetical protein